MLRIALSLLASAMLFTSVAEAQNDTGSGGKAAGETKAVKVKTRTQKLALACGDYEASKPSCKNLRTACKKKVNKGKAECKALPVEKAAVKKKAVEE